MDRLVQRRRNVPLVTIDLIEGVLSPAEKQELIHRVTEAVISLAGEPMRSVTWVRITEVLQGDWAIGGKCLDAADVKAIAGHKGTG